MPTLPTTTRAYAELAAEGFIATVPGKIAIQLPLLMRYGYSRMAVLGTTMPPALVIAAVFRLHLTLASVQGWLPLIGAAGAAVLAASAALAALHPPGPRA